MTGRTLARCPWCRHILTLRRGGSPKRFCSSQHRAEFHSAARKWAERVLVAGFVTLDAIKESNHAACTLLPGIISPATAPKEGDERDALPGLLGAIVESLSVDELAELPEPVRALLEFIAS
jgi:hypothetical protein